MQEKGADPDAEKHIEGEKHHKKRKDIPHGNI